MRGEKKEKKKRKGKKSFIFKKYKNSISVHRRQGEDHRRAGGGYAGMKDKEFELKCVSIGILILFIIYIINKLIYNEEGRQNIQEGATDMDRSSFLPSTCKKDAASLHLKIRNLVPFVHNYLCINIVYS